MIGGFGRTAAVEWKVREFFNLLGLSASAEDQETTSEADTKKDQDDKNDKKFYHGWSHGGATARVVSDDESGDDSHCWRKVWIMV